ncbi:HAMP domain-containing histidine kinase [Micromonospora sp. CPCC 205371]|nr:HAMP domain-containing histidine kinase [Micromonospora sp. CPCC 205371]
MRLSARSRLAVGYTALVFAAGVVLVVLTYVLVRRSLGSQPRAVGILGPDGSPPPTPFDSAPALETIDRMHADTLSQLLSQSVVALTIVTVLAAVLGWLVAGRVLRPIRAISATARRLSAEDLSARVPVTTPADELATLAETINGMLDRIQSGIADRDQLLHCQRMFVANAAHELRTPLTTMRTAIDVTIEGRPSTAELLLMASDVRDAVEHSQRTLDGLLMLARSQTGPGRQQTVDLADVVAGVMSTVEGVDLRADLRSAPTTGDPVLLDRMVANLVDNALRYKDPGGHAAVTTGIGDGYAYMRVANSGPAIDQSMVDKLFEPFVRGPQSHPRADGGAGLGLSIVRAVIDAHNGQVDAVAPPTGGLEITVRLRLNQ